MRHLGTGAAPPPRPRRVARAELLPGVPAPAASRREGGVLRHPPASDRRAAEPVPCAGSFASRDDARRGAASFALSRRATNRPRGRRATTRSARLPRLARHAAARRRRAGHALRQPQLIRMSQGAGRAAIARRRPQEGLRERRPTRPRHRPLPRGRDPHRPRLEQVRRARLPPRARLRRHGRGLARPRRDRDPHREHLPPQVSDPRGDDDEANTVTASLPT